MRKSIPNFDGQVDERICKVLGINYREDRESGMPDSTFAAITNELDQVLAKLKKTQDPEARKPLLIEMRRLIAELNDIVFGWKG